MMIFIEIKIKAFIYPLLNDSNSDYFILMPVNVRPF